jgi:hypothetical protein
MTESIHDKVVQALKQAENHNSNVMVKPEVILWPDPENQWVEVIGILQESMPQLLIYGKYEPQKKQGPAIWLKCMVAKALPEANWDSEIIPIIYLPGVAKSDLRKVENAVFNFQPLLEYQYTGTLFLQDNGREWSILAFVENPNYGLDVKVAKDNATKDALKRTLPNIFQDREVLANRTIIDSDYLNNQLFPDIIHSILKWMCKGDVFLNTMDTGMQEVFFNLCKSQYEFEPDHKNIKAIAEKLGSQKKSWKNVWQLYHNAPKKYPDIQKLLRLAKPDDLGTGLFELPEESWPQVNEKKEHELADELKRLIELDRGVAVNRLKELEETHAVRRNWVWFELGYSPLADALQYVYGMALNTSGSISSSSIDEVKTYYLSKGCEIDRNMRYALASVRTMNDKALIKKLISLLYKPWLVSVTEKFQTLVKRDPSIFTSQTSFEEEEKFVLFVDAFRYELAEEFRNRIDKQFGFKILLNSKWSAIPSLTPTAKPSISPMNSSVSPESNFHEFCPQLKDGRELQTAVFRKALAENGYKFISHADEINPAEKCWQEIGDIDTKGHQEQSDIVRRTDELFEKIIETLALAFDAGVKRIKIVTDHGWLLLPGGLPKTELNAGLTESRWGRCALIKEGAVTDLLHLPWRWNVDIHIAYAPGISFFKVNNEYAHGGISIHECLIPEMIIERPQVPSDSGKILEAKWVNLKCTISTENSGESHTVDIRTKYNDASTSIVESRNHTIENNKGVLMVNDQFENGAATVVLIDGSGRIIDKKSTIVGG